MSDAKRAALALAKEQAALVSDAKKAAISAAIAKSKARGAGVQVAGTGPLGLPGDVSVFGLKIPTLAIVAIGGAVVLALAALAVHAFRRKG